MNKDKIARAMAQKLKADLQNVTLGQVPDNSITDDKLDPNGIKVKMNNITSLAISNSNNIKNLNNSFVDDMITFSVTSAAPTVVLTRSTNSNVVLKSGYYFVRMKVSVEGNASNFQSTTTIKPIIWEKVLNKTYQNDQSSNIIECPNTKTYVDGAFHSVEMCTILNVTNDGNSSYIGLMMTNHVAGSNPMMITIQDLCILKLDLLSTELNTYKQSYIDLIDTYGYIDYYPLVDTRKRLDYWGDSLTEGAGGGGTTRPSVMQTLLGNSWVVKNYGVGSETSNAIACRQGGMNFVVQPFTIPADIATSVDVTIKDNFGNDVVNKSSPTGGTGGDVNPVFINGIMGILSQGATTGSNPYKFTRSIAGSEVAINRPTTIITNGMINHRNNIIIIWMGTNGGYSDTNDLIRQYQAMVDFNNTKKYLIISLTIPNTTTINTELQKAFGRHFIDARSYLIQYGLSDAGITPTTADTTAISNNNIPPSLLYDTTHFNSYGYTIIANLEYKRGQELGYW